MNITLLKKIRTAILAKPKRFDMGWWIETNMGYAPCGTVACLAGFAVLLNETKGSTGPKAWRAAADRRAPDQDSIANEAQKILDLNASQRTALFAVGGWPLTFQEAYREAQTEAQQAKAAAARITHLIKTGK